MKDHPKYNRLIHVARELFSQVGVRKVSIEEICSQAGVSKMTFYKFFKNKHEIATAVIEDFIDEATQNYEKIMANDKSFHDKVQQLIQFKANRGRSLGGRFTEDIVTDPELSAYLKKRTEETQDFSIRLFQEGQRAGYIRADMPQEFFLLIMQNFIQFVQSPQFRALFPDMEQRVVQASNFFFYGLIDPEKLKGGNP